MMKAAAFASLCAAHRKKSAKATVVIKVKRSKAQRKRAKAKAGGQGEKEQKAQDEKAQDEGDAFMMARKALAHWEGCIDFVLKLCPPWDESIVCYATHAVLSALALESNGADAAAKHMKLAAEAHAIAFGPGLEYFKARYSVEVAHSPLGPEFGARFWELAAGHCSAS
jgi:hypothetical protein